MVVRIACLLALAVTTGFCGDWNARLAADYLDARQKAWFAWPAAMKGDNGVCLSCHTGLTYMLARPALRKALGENAPSPYEQQMLDSVRKRLAKRKPQDFGANEPHASEALGVESVLSTLLLASVDARNGKLSGDTEQAFDRMWALQLTNGDYKGAWVWNSYDLDPWEEPHSMFYGAALAAIAVGTAPEGYQKRHAIRENLDWLRDYLTKNQASQPLHNRLLLVWASTKMKGLLNANDCKAILDQAVALQAADGGWSIEAIGPWKAHPNAPAGAGSNCYATALVAFILRETAGSKDNLALRNAQRWLRSHQDPKGYWDAQSMNKHFQPDSMPSQFMRDAATSYASLALVE
jgi:squalene-hopene/tetraprenyl-beta-curcumene cyclase